MEGDIVVETLVTSITNFLRQKHIILLTSLIVSVALLICIASSIFMGLALLSSYFGGMLFFHSLINHSVSPPNMLFMLKRRKRIVSRSEMPRSCAICGNSRCHRHKPDFNLYNLQPWSEIKIPQEVDEALEDFLNTTLNKYVNTWYREISDDEFFVHELRLCLRFMVAVLLRRSMKIDLTVLITEKLLKAAIQHLDCFMQANRFVGSRTDTEQAVLDYLSTNLHVALHTRRQELKYLQLLSQNMMQFLVPRRYMNCKSLMSLLPEIVSGSILLSAMDVIADPFTVNSLLMLFFDKTPMVRYPECNSRWVEVLSNFVESSVPSRKSTLHIPLSSILNNQRLLYPFMQFMKEEAAINVLQFCLAVEDLNRQILDPDLTSEQQVRLHKEAKNLYETYCAPDAVDRIQLDKNVVEELKKIVYGAPEEIVKLRTTTPLFKSYDQAYNLLENTFCPLFYQSDHFFTLLCGKRLTESSEAAAASRTQKKPMSTYAKIGHKFNKIKGVFRPATVEGKADVGEYRTDNADAVYPEDAMYAQELDVGESHMRKRDMSAWRISIPNLETQLEEGWKAVFVYNIEVQSIDTRGNNDPDSQHWLVKRRYHEFYVLEAKLIEFHGELEGAHLPPKRGHGRKGLDIPESRRKLFEQFLQKLLAKPHLRNSELLYMFLTPGAEFSTNMMPDLNLGKMIKTMPMKLMKEKGQHLETFLQAFIQSTEAPSPRPSKFECRDINDVPELEFSRKLMNSRYGNNANVTRGHREVSGRLRHEINIVGIYDYLLYLAVRVFDIPMWFLHCLMAVRLAAKTTVEAFVMWYIDLKLEQALVPQRLVNLINLLKGAVFESSSEVPSGEEKIRVAEQGLARFREAIPETVVRAIGVEKFTEGTQTIFNLLQYPRLNKQLTYTLLDILATELFPELAWPSLTQRNSVSE